MASTSSRAERKGCAPEKGCATCLRSLRQCPARLSSGRDVVDLLREVVIGNISIPSLTYENDFMMTAMKVNEHYWILDGHKRLWVMQILEKAGKCSKIKVRISNSSKWNKRYKYLTQKSNQVQLRYANYAEKMHLDKKYNLLLKEIQERSYQDPFVYHLPIRSSYFHIDPVTPPQRLVLQLQKAHEDNGYFPWYRGPYHVDAPVLRLIFAFMLIIVLSLLCKVIIPENASLIDEPH